MTGVTTTNPATGERLAHYPCTTPAELEAALDAARHTVDRTPPAKLRTLATQLRANSGVLASLITTEMGKPIDQARAEIEKCAAATDYYAAHAEELRTPRRVDVAPDTAAVHARPLGVLLAIMPWNYPFWQVVRSMIPAIAIGNTVILKHADNVTGSALALQAILDETLGQHVLTTVVLPADRTGQLIDNPGIAAVAFTGSHRVGAIVGARAGAAVKKTVLELGGSDPFIVLPDADVPAAASAAIRSRFLNNGQSCIAAKRMIVHHTIRDEFVDVATTELDKLIVGDPAQPGTDIGPMARTDLRDQLRRQLDATLHSGATRLRGAIPDAGPGAWFPPTLLEVPHSATAAFQEETFGPLGAILAVASEGEAITVANDSPYGLGASIWSRDIDRAQALANRLAAGALFINRISESDPRLPVGGVKSSGHGRELGSHGALEFANIQPVRIAS